MTPLHFMMQMAQSFAAATLQAQSACWDATLASGDKLTRIHEKPADAADRAAANAQSGAAKSWYRAPAASWSEITTTAAGAHPAAAMMTAFGRPVMFGLPLNPPFGSGFGAGFGPEFAKGLAAFQNPLLGMMLTAPFAVPSLFGAQPGLSVSLADGTTLKTDFVPSSRPETKSSKSAPPASAGVVDHANPDAAGRDAPAGDAVASITMPDNTVYKITIPMAGPLPFWPWASGFGAAPHATPAMIEATPVDETDS